MKDSSNTSGLCNKSVKAAMDNIRAFSKEMIVWGKTILKFIQRTTSSLVDAAVRIRHCSRSSQSPSRIRTVIRAFSATCNRSDSHPLNADQKKTRGVWSSCAVHYSSDPPDRRLESWRISRKGGLTPGMGDHLILRILKFIDSTIYRSQRPQIV